MCDLTSAQARVLLNLIEIKQQNLERALRVLKFRPRQQDQQQFREVLDGIEELKINLPSDPKRRLSQDQRRQLRRLENKIAIAAAKCSGIEFVNRTEELNIITNYDSQEFIMVDAPARYGKTYLLEQAQSRLEKRGWYVLSLNFSDYPDSAKSLDGFFQLIFRLLQSKAPTDADDYDDVLGLRDAIIGELSLKGSKVALILDEAERVIQPALIAQIREFLKDLRSAIKGRSNNNLFRCVVAGRYIQGRWQSMESGYALGHIKFYTDLPLSPFTESIITEALQKMLEKANRGRGMELSSAMLLNVANFAKMVSSGYPECLVSVLLDLGAHTGFTIRDGFIKEHYQAFFGRHVRPVLPLMLDGAPSNLKRIFPYLSILRCYDADILDHVLRWCRSQKKFSDKKSLNSMLLLTELSQYALLKRDSNTDLWGDAHIRQVLAFQKWLEQTNIARRLNELAIKIYTGWLDEPGERSLSNRKQYEAVIVEYLYHLSIALANDPDRKREMDERADFLQRKLLWAVERYEYHFNLRVASDRKYIEDALVEKILADEEIMGQISHFCGPDAFELRVRAAFDGRPPLTD